MDFSHPQDIRSTINYSGRPSLADNNNGGSAGTRPSTTYTQRRILKKNQLKLKMHCIFCFLFFLTGITKFAKYIKQAEIKRNKDRSRMNYKKIMGVFCLSDVASPDLS